MNLTCRIFFYSALLRSYLYSDTRMLTFCEHGHPFCVSIICCIRCVPTCVLKISQCSVLYRIIAAIGLGAPDSSTIRYDRANVRHVKFCSRTILDTCTTKSFRFSYYRSQGAICSPCNVFSLDVLITLSPNTCSALYTKYSHHLS